METKGSSTSSNITNKGVIKLVNLQTSTETRIYVKSTETSVIKPIASVAAREFNFNRSVNVIANPVEASSSVQFVAGLVCSGSESTVKECTTQSSATSDASLYELEVEFLCKLRILAKFIFT